MATETQIRAALAWETGTEQPPEKNVWEWLWEAIQGDFNDNRTTGQIAFDAAVSIIPVVDQICDVRDIIANCRAIANSEEKDDNTWKWVALVLTLIGLFPSLGSIVKGVLKIFFVFMRRYGLDKLIKASDDAMTWVVTFLRKREVQKLLKQLKVDEVFAWLAKEVKALKGKVNTAALLQNFDKVIGLLKKLLDKVTAVPYVGQRAKQAIEMVEKVRKMADAHIGKALEPVQKMLDAIIHRLEMEHLVQRSGILDAKNMHFRGTLPEAQAVTLMRTTKPRPSWMSEGKAGKWAEQDLTDGLRDVAKQRKLDPHFPTLTDGNIKSFHKMAPDVIKGPAKLYRVTSPGNGAMGDCWFSEEVWKKLQSAPDPKSAWRKYLAVWPDWNANGQFVVYELKAGEELKVWRGPAAMQTKKELKDVHLEGGYEQIIFKPNADAKAGKVVVSDTMKFYKRTGKEGATLSPTDLTYPQYKALPDFKKQDYVSVRETIHDKSIVGPLDTGWGMTDFDGQLRNVKLGLPNVSGQITNR